MSTRQPPAQDPIASFARAAAAVADLIADVRPGQWHDPTPCTEWDTSQLVDHLITGNQHFASLVRGQPSEPAAPAAGGRAKDYHVSAAALRAAFAAPGALERIYQSPAGPAPGTALIHLRITEQLVHGWDLARATGQPSALPEDLARQALALSRAQLSDTPREHLPFGPPQPVSGDALAADQLAAFFGRRP